MLGTNMFFWDWLGAPIAQPPPAPLPPDFLNSGARNNDYRPLTEEYWAEREGRMTQDRKTPREIFFNPPELVSPTPANNSGIAGVAERKQLLSAMTAAGSVDDLKTIAARLRQLNK